MEAADGALWIASGSGLARWHKGVLTFFTERDGAPPGAIRGVFQTTDNSLWVWADTGLKRLENGRFVPVSGVAADSISQVISASDGSLWVASPHQMAIYRSGHWSNLPEDTRNGQIEFVAALPDGASAVGTSRDIAICDVKRRPPVRRTWLRGWRLAGNYQAAEFSRFLRIVKDHYGSAQPRACALGGR